MGFDAAKYLVLCQVRRPPKLASMKLQGLEGANSDQTAGIAIVRMALQAPLRQIAENAGVDGSVVAGEVLESTDASFGFNDQTEEARRGELD